MTRTFVRRAAILLVVAALAACSSNSDEQDDFRPSPSISSAPQWPAEVQDAGYRSPGPDSLASDPAWQKQLQQRVLELNPKDRMAPQAADVTVVSSFDFGRIRYAEVVYPSPPAIWNRLLLVGPAGAAAADLDEAHRTSLSEELDASPVAVFLIYRRTAQPDDPAGVVLISATGAREVALTHGSAQTEWSVPTQVETGTWAADLLPRDLDEPGYTVDGRGGHEFLTLPWPR